MIIQSKLSELLKKNYKEKAFFAYLKLKATLKNPLSEKKERKTKIPEELKNLRNLKLVTKSQSKKIAIKTKRSIIATDIYTVNFLKLDQVSF